MKITDPLYGQFTVPRYLANLLVTPEVRRLSQIRLLNALSPSLAALGEVRRYSHTLGVLYLCQAVRLDGYSLNERKALLASVLLHDIGTPPFAHLFEYHLRDRTGWSHEGMIKNILWGLHAPENRAHQFFAGRTIEFRRALKRSGILVDLVSAIVSEQHPLAKFLFGTLDLDNLDNVARMGWALGLDSGSAHAVAIAASLEVGRDSLLRLPRATAAPAVAGWVSLRRAIYEIVVFDPPTVSAQAVLSHAIGLAISEDLLTEAEWSLTDEQLLELLRGNRLTRDLVTREYLARLPTLAFCMQLNGTLLSLGLSTRETCKASVESVLSAVFPKTPVFGYVFVDRGTFEKRLEFLDPRDGEEWTVGDTSESVVVYGFVRTARTLRWQQCQEVADAFRRRHAINRSQVKRELIGPDGTSDDDQTSFNIQTA